METLPIQELAEPLSSVPLNNSLSSRQITKAHHVLKQIHCNNSLMNTVIHSASITASDWSPARVMHFSPPLALPCHARHLTREKAWDESVTAL